MTDTARLADDLAKLEALAKAPRAWAKDWTKADYKAEAEEAHKETLRACAIARRFEAEANTLKSRDFYKDAEARVSAALKGAQAQRERAERAEALAKWRGVQWERSDQLRMKYQQERDAAKAALEANTQTRDAELEQAQSDLARLREAAQEVVRCVSADDPITGHTDWSNGCVNQLKAALSAGDGETDLERELKTTPEIAPAKPAEGAPKELRTPEDFSEWANRQIAALKPPAPCPGIFVAVGSFMEDQHGHRFKDAHCPSCKGA